MEIINAIEEWSYTAIELILLIYCLIKLRNRGGGFLAVGFGVSIIMSLIWRSVDIFQLQLKRNIFEVLRHVNVFAYLIFAGFFIVGISKISSLSNIQKEGSMQKNSGKMSLSQILFSFSGRIGRGTFWGVWFSMAAVSLFVGLIIVGVSSRGDEGALATIVVIYLLFLIPTVWIGLSMQVKRWHDRDKSGWMVLINFIPIIGAIWALVELGFLRGTIGRNLFGEDPLRSSVTTGETAIP